MMHKKHTNRPQTSTTLKTFCAIAAETGQQPEVIDVQTAYLEAPEENLIFMERASFADYINMKDHELETLREKIIKMTAEELKKTIASRIEPK